MMFRCYANNGFPLPSFFWIPPVRHSLSAGLQVEHIVVATIEIIRTIIRESHLNIGIINLWDSNLSTNTITMVLEIGFGPQNIVAAVADF